MKIQHIVSKIKLPFFIISGLLLIFAALGIYLLPAILKSKLPVIIQQETGRSSHLASIELHAFPLAASIKGFEVQEHNGQPFVSFDELHFKIGVFKSIGQQALVFDEISINKPFVHIGRQKNGALNFQDMVKAKATDKPEDESPLFPVTIEKLSLSEGTLVWEDASLAKPVKEDLQPINLTVENFTTHTDGQARLVLSLALKSGGQLDWQGTASLKPLASEGHIKFDKVLLETLIAHVLPDDKPFYVKGYELLNADYAASYLQNSLKLTVKKGIFELRDFQFIEKSRNQALVKMPVFAMRGIDFDLGQQNVVIDSVSAQDADLQAWLDATGVINYQALLPVSKTGNKLPNQATANVAAPKAVPWKIKVNTLALANFSAAFEDRSVNKPVLFTIKPINFKLSRYTNEPGASVPFELDAVLNKTGLIKLAGDTVIQPFATKVAIDVKGINLENFQPYVNKFAPIELVGGKFAIDGLGQVATSAKDKLGITFKGNSGISNLVVKDRPLDNKAKAKVLADIPAFTLRGIDFNLANQTLVLGTVAANNAKFEAWLNPEGILNYQTLLPPQTAPGNTINKLDTALKPKSPAWDIKVSSLELTDWGLNFEDQTQKKPVVMSFKPINFKLSQYSNQNGRPLPVQLSVGLINKGSISLKGDAVIEPLAAKLDMDVKNVDLEKLQPYFDKFLRLEFVDGALNIDGNVLIASKGEDKLDVKFKGNTGIARLLTRDLLEHKDLVKWENLTLQDVDIDLLANRYSAKLLVIDKPYARVAISKDKSTNFDGIAITEQSNPAVENKHVKPKQTAQARPKFTLGKIQIVEGASDFSDFSLILPFAAQIQSLDGGASGISSDQKSSFDMSLKGTAYDLAPVDIKGKISPYLGDYHVQLNFVNLPMPLVSPYMVQFAGYKVEKGKLTLGLNYNVDNGILTASNSILIDQFELGDKVENPNAVSLPLKLAVALLKDGNGKIKIDVPIYGSLDDPKFNIGAIVADALINAIRKVVMSPFSLLGSLAGSDKEMSTITFPAGNSTLGQSQRDKLDSLSKALKERLALNIDIKGAAFQEHDWPVIREDALYVQLKKRRAIEINKEAETKIREEYVELTEDDYKRLLAEMFIEKFPQLAKKSFFGQPTLTNPESGDFYVVAKQNLFTIIKPEQERLNVLATARAQNIANYFVKTGGIANERVYMLDTVIDPAWGSKGIVSALSLNAAE
ncbi:MAG: DUF748 domain-containing protein [Methylococcales bacterium]|nr:DUF748 domain-containing protein [Methylococcales bacterium]